MKIGEISFFMMMIETSKVNGERKRDIMAITKVSMCSKCIIEDHVSVWTVQTIGVHMSYRVNPQSYIEDNAKMGDFITLIT